MARGRVTPELETYVRERRRKGLSHRAIVAELVARGTPLSLGTVANIAPAHPKRHDEALGHATSPVSVSVDTIDEELLEVPDGAEQEDLEGLLRRQLGVVQRLSRKAEVDGNLAAFASIQRVLNATAALLSKVQPPPPPDPEANPDMQKAAKLAAEKLHSLIDEALRAA